MKNHLLPTVAILLFICFEGRAQSLRQPMHASYTGLGAYSIKMVDLFSFSANPAVLAQLKEKAVGVYTERRFMLNALTQTNIVAAVPTGSGNFALQVNYFGSGLYYETQLGGTYARSLGTKLDIGLGFHYNRIGIPGYLRADAVVAEAGLMMHFTEKLHGGLAVYNPTGGMLQRSQREKIATVFRGGLGLDASDLFYISAEMIKEENRPAGVLVGFQYKPIAQLLIRGGINTMQQQPFFGAGMLWEKLRIDIAATFHPQLGLSPGLLFLYRFKNQVP